MYSLFPTVQSFHDSRSPASPCLWNGKKRWFLSFPLEAQMQSTACSSPATSPQLQSSRCIQAFLGWRKWDQRQPKARMSVSQRHPRGRVGSAWLPQGAQPCASPTASLHRGLAPASQQGLVFGSPWSMALFGQHKHNIYLGPGTFPLQPCFW